MIAEFNKDKIAAMPTDDKAATRGKGKDNEASAKTTGCCKKGPKKGEVENYKEGYEMEVADDGQHLEKEPEVWVTRDDFVKVRAGKSPTASMGIIIFFLQSLGLIMKNSSAFGVMEALNLDTEKAAKECISPLSTTGRFYAKVTLTPVILCCGVCLMVPVWNRLRRSKLLAKVWAKMDAPEKVEVVHFKRALLNIFLFCYAPLTQSAVQMMICIDTCTDGAECVAVMEIDFGMHCDSADVNRAQLAAFGVLFGMCVFIPGVLIRWAYQGVQERKVSLSLKLTEVESWFDDIDDDDSGFLEIDEMSQLLHRMSHMRPSEDELKLFCRSNQKAWEEWLESKGLTGTQHPDSTRRNFWQHKTENSSGKVSAKEMKAMRKTMLEIHNVFADREGGDRPLQDLSPKERAVAEIPPVSRAQFGCWMQYKIESMASTPYDILYGTTKYSAYYWFAQVLLLKTIINILFSFGSASDFEWHVWMHLTLAVSVCLMVLVTP